MCCTGCQEDARQEQITCKAEICQKETCSSGPIPELHHDIDDIDVFVYSLCRSSENKFACSIGGEVVADNS
jgi:hypothetical protein